MKSKFSPSFMLSNCARLESQDKVQDKVPQDFSVGIFQRTSEMHTFSEQDLPQHIRDVID